MGMVELNFMEFVTAQENGLMGKLLGDMDSRGLNFYFTKGDDIFGGPEESRIAFARMKNPTEDEPSSPDDTFNAFQIAGDPTSWTQKTFSMRDLPAIIIIDQDAAAQKASRKSKK